MLFSSVPFLYYFLPCVITVYFLVPKTLKNTVLLFSSLFFYGYGEPKFLLFMIVSIIQGYVFGRLLGMRKDMAKSSNSSITNRKSSDSTSTNNDLLNRILMISSVIISLAMLCYCKYMNFFIENFNELTGLSIAMLNIALPIGISFYTFQNISYVVDVYSGRVRCQKNFIDLALYIAMFPQLIAGPIVRYKDIEQQLSDRSYSSQKIATGIRRFVIGLSKKVLLANVLGELVELYKANPDEQTVAFTWLYAIAFTLQIYFDFSGYSDMAIGLGHIFGFTLPENFNYPYVSKSITEFWRRWHISLGQWFRDYLYIPLGGNRVTTARWFINIMVVWFATGFWHGAAWNFILWGLLYAVLLICEKVFFKRAHGGNHTIIISQKEAALKSSIIITIKAVASHIYTMFFVILGFILFDAETLSIALENMAAFFSISGLPFISDFTVYAYESYFMTIVMAIVCATPLLKKAYFKISGSEKSYVVVMILEPICIAVMLVICSAYLVDGSFNPFLYFRF